jgi:Leucine-rich repeat (LRR) protein
MLLTELNLSWNMLTNLDGLSHLRHLLTLRVDHNQLLRLDGIESLTTLQVLSAVDNVIDVITPSIRHCKRLTSIALDSNKIHVVCTQKMSMAYL